MKILIKENINPKNISNFIPKQYLSILSTNLLFDEISIIVFPCDKEKVVISKYINKSIQKMKNNNTKKVYFGGCFTLEAKEIIKNSNSLYFALNNFEWTDNSYLNI